jgi:hypothetical protein
MRRGRRVSIGIQHAWRTATAQCQRVFIAWTSWRASSFVWARDFDSAMVSWFARSVERLRTEGGLSAFASLFEIAWKDARPVTDSCAAGAMR